MYSFECIQMKLTEKYILMRHVIFRFRYDFSKVNQFLFYSL